MVGSNEAGCAVLELVAVSEGAFTLCDALKDEDDVAVLPRVSSADEATAVGSDIG